jgi:hypothetical protein
MNMPEIVLESKSDLDLSAQSGGIVDEKHT